MVVGARWCSASAGEERRGLDRRLDQAVRQGGDDDHGEEDGHGAVGAAGRRLGVGSAVRGVLVAGAHLACSFSRIWSSEMWCFWATGRTSRLAMKPTASRPTMMNSETV
ncbi:hypothetical protein ACFFX0_08725 [Citricoccus parietis]|uniref:Uncharacterized protein n=1 Tax=Citricoccus parietis TaxID=592307 RepID=A0ABV5FX56_9MICC